MQISRKDILTEAAVLTSGSRQSAYGDAKTNFETVGVLWSAYLRSAHPQCAYALAFNGITAKDVAMMLSLLKIARAAAGQRLDNYVDLAGYAAIAGEIDMEKAPDEENKPTDEIPLEVRGATR